MAEIVNLRLARKRAARSKAGREAETKRARHGLSRSQKAFAEAGKALADSRLDAHRREDGASPERTDPA